MNWKFYRIALIAGGCDKFYLTCFIFKIGQCFSINNVHIFFFQQTNIWWMPLAPDVSRVKETLPIFLKEFFTNMLMQLLNYTGPGWNKTCSQGKELVYILLISFNIIVMIIDWDILYTTKMSSKERTLNNLTWPIGDWHLFWAF